MKNREEIKMDNNNNNNNEQNLLNEETTPIQNNVNPLGVQNNNEEILNQNISNTNQTPSPKINNSDKKVLGTAQFIIHMLLSFIVWDLIINFVFDFISGLFDFGLNINAIIIFTNLLWIGETAAVMFLTYFFNRKHTVNESSLKNMRLLMLIVFGITILINYKFIKGSFYLNSTLTIIFILIHIVLIYFLNHILFKHYIAN